MESVGGVAADYHGSPLMRHFGDPAGEYEAATQGLAVFDRSHRTRLVVRGRAPGQMLNGVLTGTIPGPPIEAGEGVVGGTATYHAVLTPKGKMITDLWAILRGDEDSAGFLLDVPVAGREGLLENFGKVLPPRLARVEDVSDRTGMITVVGPQAADAVSSLALGHRVEVTTLAGLAEGDWRCSTPTVEEGLIVARTAEVWPEAYSVLGPSEAVAELWQELVRDGARPAGLGVWSTLRVEAARPTFGTDMSENTIPVEAGIHIRAIDQGKGCYTGQEVIVRIRDRGHVNRTLRQLRLGDVPSPAKGTELYSAGDGPKKPVGWITSAVQSPRFGEVVALGYVKRGVETVTLDGRAITVPSD